MFRLPGRRTKVRLVGPPSVITGAPSDWLRSLRWVAIAGMLCTILIGRIFVPGIRIQPLLATLVAIALLNTFGMIWKRPKTIAYDLAADVVALGAVLWYSGGVDNPFAVFLSFQVMVAGLLASPAVAAWTGAVVVAVAPLLFFAPPLPWGTAGAHAEKARRLGESAALVGVAVFIGVSSYAYGRKLGELRAEAGRAARFADLGRIGAAIAHELNTPLGTILVASQELVLEVATGKLREAAELGDVIAGQAKRASDTIALLRGQIRTDDLEKSLDIGRFLSEFVPSELARLGFGGTFRLNICSEAWALAIPAALQQILSNLLKNAIEALTGVRDGRIEVSAEDQDRGIVIAVQDNGCGIRKEDLQRIGQPFHTTKAREGGAGLGLYVCGLLARQMGAELEVATSESDSDFGSTTTLSLTLRTAPSISGGDHAGH